MSDPVDTTSSGSDGVPQHAAPEEPEDAVSAEVSPERTDELSPRPEPVLNAARVAGVISAVILGIGGVLKLAGVLIPRDYDLQSVADQTSNAVLSIGAAWALFGPWLTARIRARDKVTPLSDPRDAAGTKLIPAEET